MNKRGSGAGWPGKLGVPVCHHQSEPESKLWNLQVFPRLFLRSSRSFPCIFIATERWLEVANMFSWFKLSCSRNLRQRYPDWKPLRRHCRRRSTHQSVIHSFPTLFAAENPSRVLWWLGTEPSWGLSFWFSFGFVSTFGGGWSSLHAPDEPENMQRATAIRNSQRGRAGFWVASSKRNSRLSRSNPEKLLQVEL